MKPLNRSNKKSLICEINVVPYIDVMLVLLVIFMATAPLLTQGVQVNLPTAQAEVLPEDQSPPLVVTVDAQGQLYLDQSKVPMDTQTLSTNIQAALLAEPKRSVLIRGDKEIDYGRVLQAMVLLKAAGAAKIGLMTEYASE
jgi:biopolymer transport protein TolR